MGLFTKRSPSAASARAEPTTTSERVSGLTEVERDWIASLLAIVADAGTDIDDARQIRALYDDAVTRWHRVNPPERIDPEPMVNAIGTALGEHLARRMPLRWALTIGGGRTELGLVDGAGRVALVPTELVAEHWRARQDGGFITDIVEGLADRLPRDGARRRG
jgi:hypothetical protein